MYRPKIVFHLLKLTRQVFPELCSDLRKNGQVLVIGFDLVIKDIKINIKYPTSPQMMFYREDILLKATIMIQRSLLTIFDRPES